MKIRSKWFPDTRILIGLALIAASFIGVFFVIKTNNSKSQVYVATRPLSIGDKFDAKQFSIVEANLGANLDKYITPGSLPNAVFNRPIMPGEFLPKSALVPVLDKDIVAVVLRIAGDLPGDVKGGDLVDVWAAVKIKEEGFWQSELIAKTLRVSRVIVSTSQFDPRGTTKVEVQASRDRLSYLLNAIANQDKVSIVRASHKEIELLRSASTPRTLDEQDKQNVGETPDTNPRGPDEKDSNSESIHDSENIHEGHE